MLTTTYCKKLFNFFCLYDIIIYNKGVIVLSNTIIITGAAGGIGSALTVKFAANGWNVVANYNKSYSAAKLLRDSLVANGASIVTCQADLTKRNEVFAMVDTALSRFGRIDALINNAGISQQKLFTDITDDDWDIMMSTNLKSAFLCSQAVLPDMISNKSGKIVNISSMWGVSGASCEVHYSASKAGMIGLTKALAKEVAPSGINVNCIAPGLIETSMNDNFTVEELSEFINEIPLGRMGTPSEVAELAYFLCSENADYLTGQVISQDGGINI